MFKYIDGTPISDIGRRLNISSENNGFGFNSFKKNQLFKKKSNLNAFGSKFDLDVK